MLVRKVFGTLLLMGLVASIGSARADLKNQYSNQGCTQWYSNEAGSDDGSFKVFCVDQGGSIFQAIYDRGDKELYFKERIGEVDEVNSNYSQLVRRTTLFQFEFEGVNLVSYVCGASIGSMDCSTEIEKTVLVPVQIDVCSDNVRTSKKLESGWLVDECHWYLNKNKILRFYARPEKGAVLRNYRLRCNDLDPKYYSHKFQRAELIDGVWSDWHRDSLVLVLDDSEAILFDEVCDSDKYWDLVFNL